METSPISEWLSDEHLTAKEVRILVYFMRVGPVVVPREVLIREIWGSRPPQSERSVDAAISKLRRKLNRKKVRLVTVYGGGYRWFPIAN